MNAMRIKIRHLHCFLEVERLGDLDRAAEHLTVGRDVVEAAIDKLERQIGVPLFTREAARWQLTAAGQRLLPFAHRGMDALHDGILRQAQEELETPGER